MLRVAVVSPWDLEDPFAWSGVVKPMVDALRTRCELIPVSTFGVRDSIVDRVACRLIDGRGGRKYLVGHAVATSIKRGRELSRRLKQAAPDVVLAIAASQDLAYLRYNVPVVQVSDTTLTAISGYYELFTNLHRVSSLQAKNIAGRSSSRANHTLAATDWAKSALIRDDGLAESSVSVAPFGPAIMPTGETAARPKQEPLKLLAVISDWERKGGDWVLAAFEEMLRRGLPVSVTMVGNTPKLPTTVTSMGRVSRETLSGLYASHHVLLELARSNAAGVTLTDAAAFSLPAIATRTGGVPTIIEDGVTGILVDGDGDRIVEETAAAVEAHWNHFRDMGAAAGNRSKEILNWDVWAQTAMNVMDHVAG